MHPVLSRETSISNATRRMAKTDFLREGRGELRHRPAPCVHLPGHELQVRGVHTVAIPAQVVRLKTGGDGPVRALPVHTVRKCGTAPIVDVDLPVAAGMSPIPVPASSRNVHDVPDTATGEKRHEVWREHLGWMEPAIALTPVCEAARGVAIRHPAPPVAVRAASAALAAASCRGAYCHAGRRGSYSPACPGARDGTGRCAVRRSWKHPGYARDRLVGLVPPIRLPTQ